MKALQKLFAQKWFIYVVCTAIIFSSYSFAGLAKAQTSDIKGHWAEKQLEEWQNKGLLQGFSDGSLKPNSSITRAELATLMNRYFNFTEQKEIHFSDLTKDQWQYPELAKAAQAGYIDGYSDGTIRPDKQVSRQEVAVMLANVMKVSDVASESGTSSFKDGADIASWSKSAVSMLVTKGLISGYGDGTFRPQASLTRAEAVVLLSRIPNAQSIVYDKAGTYGPATGMEMVTGNVIINATGVTLQNTMIHGNLVLGKDIGSGDATLKNVKVEGTTTVSGGGEKSIHLVDTILVKLIVNKETGVVRIVVEGSSSVQDTLVLSAVILEEGSTLTGAGFVNVLLSKGLTATLIGAFKELKIEATNMKIEILKGSVESVTVDGSGNSITLSKDASIVKLILNALTQLLGSGKVSTATVNEGGKGSSFATAPGKVDGPQSGSIKSGGTTSSGGSGSGGGSNGGSGGGGDNGGNGENPDTSVPATPTVTGISEGQTYTSGVLPNWTDASETTSTATLNGAAYTKGQGITEAGEYTLVVTALHGLSGKTSKTTVKFKVDPALKLIGYVAGWEDWSANAKTVDATKLTHINYAFTHIKDHKILPLEEQNDDDNYAYLSSLKAKNPSLKILNSVGGWAADGFSDAVLTAESRETFAKSITDYVVKYDLDGIDLDWEYPTQTAGDTVGRPVDKENFTLMLKLLREKLNTLGLEHNKYYELTIAAGAGWGYLAGVEIDKIAPLLDNINVMTYDFAGGWVANASHHTNLYGKNISVDLCVDALLKSKVPAHKIVIGAAFYSHMWTNVTSIDNGGLGQAATGSGETPTYDEILAKYNAANGYQRYWDDEAKAPYLFNGSTFLSYDDPESLAAKAKYVLDHKLGGAMFWEYSNDSTGILVSSLANGLKGIPYEPDATIPDKPVITGVSEGETYTSGVLPNWVDAATSSTVITATLNGALYTKGKGITEAGDYKLIVTALNVVSGRTSNATVKFKVEPALKLVGYVAGWKDWSAESKSVDATKLTHINYAFTHIEDNKILPIVDQNDDDNYAYLSSLKAQNPNLKILNSIGGWAADGFSDAALTPESRETFVKSILDYMVKYDLDGIDLDWEYPTQTAGDTVGRPEDKQNFTLLLQLLREDLNTLGLQNNKYYELTIAAGAGWGYLAGVEIDKIAPLLDNINIMTYDFAGGWVPNASHHTNLYGNNISVDLCVDALLKSNVPANKIVIGAAFYSHMWTDVKSTDNDGLGQAATGSGDTPSYDDILANYNAAHGYKRYWDEVAKAPYLFNGSTFLSYDDPESLYEKAKYVLDKKLGGAMFWEYSGDSTGALLTALANGLKGIPYEPEIQAPDVPDAADIPMQ